jgi:Tfp pilus assembly pilus retraction ATPase PilT
MGRDLGMQLFDQALQQALTAKEIDPDDAAAYVSDKRILQKFVTDTTMLARHESTGTHSVGT